MKHSQLPFKILAIYHAKFVDVPLHRYLIPDSTGALADGLDYLTFECIT